MSVLRGALRIEEGAVAEPECSSATLYFDFDSSGLTAESNAQLSELAPCLSRNAGGIRLEGHCDERGTTEYNLALGQRRANSVESALVSLGLSPQRIDTVSYGEERPANTGSSESAWSDNRRVEMRLDR
ncbi:MAG: OmpA family protein [Proteobacteria bacterium]|nr:OmpA family protein [Pseudomonadota bacterium]MCP4916071.1 OmpA family protein [Pseudomonadota bacterium]